MMKINLAKHIKKSRKYVYIVFGTFFLSALTVIILSILVPPNIENGILADISVYTTIVSGLTIPFFLALLPTGVEQKIDSLDDRLALPLKNSDEVFEKALELLEQIKTEQHSTFKYTSATPFFGIYQKSKTAETKERLGVEKWQVSLYERIQAGIIHKSITTEICCLLWEPFSIGRSPLYTLCQEIYNDEGNKVQTKKHSHCNENEHVYDNENVKELYESCLRHWTKISDLLQHHKNEIESNNNFTIFASKRVYDIFVFYAESAKIKECVISFLCKDKDGNFSMTGIHSKDDRWLKTANNLFEKIKTNSFAGIEKLLILDKRNSHQKKRDVVLLSYYCKLFHTRGKEAYEAIKYNDIITKDILYLAKYVFPLHITKGSKYWPDAISYLRNILSQHQPETVGIDIRTGCGALALDLAYQFCDKVYAIEGDPKAMSNALMNYNRFNTNKNIPCKDKKHNIFFYCGTQVSEGCLPDDLFSSYKKFIITYNYIFYESIFCTMSYDFLFEKFNRKYIQEYLDDNMSKKAFKTNIEWIINTLSRKDKHTDSIDLLLIIPCSATLLGWSPSDVLDNIIEEINLKFYTHRPENRRWHRNMEPKKFGHADGRLLMFHLFLSSNSTCTEIVFT